MIQDNIKQSNYVDLLEQEVEEILLDPTFLRSPIQAKLLRFLCEKAVAGGQPPTQYEVAVDGLSRDPDSDLTHDSYPRVQVSRLRSNIEAHYSRNRPLNGFRVAIKPGSYQLDLEPEPTQAQPRALVQNHVAAEQEPSMVTVSHTNKHGDYPRTRDLIMEILSRPGPLIASYILSLLAAVAATLGAIAIL